MPKKPIRVLFVCAGNICRSPMAEAVFRDLARKGGILDALEIDSAATGPWHVGHPPDPRTLQTLREHHIPCTGMTARTVEPNDFRHFDYILAMDRENLADLVRENPDAPCHLLLEWNPGQAPRDEVPDPYTTGKFSEVYQLVLPACQNLLSEIAHQLSHSTR